MNGPSMMDARFLANSFLGLNYVFSVQVWYICSNLIDLSKIHFIYSKVNLRPKNCLLEIRASNLEGPLIHGDDSILWTVWSEQHAHCTVQDQAGK